MELIVALFMIVSYFLPTIVAFMRHKLNTAAIFIVNLLFGWTVIGWLWCMIWSLLADQSRVVTYTQRHYE